MSKRYNIKDIKEKVKKINSEYDILSKEYKNNKEKIIFLHTTCDNEFLMSFHEFSAGNRCPFCRYKKMAEKRTISFDDMKLKIEKITNNEYEILKDNYINTKEKAWFFHNKCGHTFSMTPNHFLAGNRCPKCSIKSRLEKRRFNIKYYQDIINKFDSSFIIDNKVEYSNCMTNINIYHTKCANTFSTSLNNIVGKFNRYGKFNCPICIKNKKKEKATKLFNELKEKYPDSLNNNYEISNVSQNINICCPKCKKEYTSELNIFYKRKTDLCYQCRTSNNEEFINLYLKNNNFKYEREKIFKGCKYKKPLKFDFYLKDLNIAIEYDGEFHYLPIFGIDSLNKQKKRDSIKDEYCKKNNIILIRIPYFESDNIIDILNKNLLN